MDHPVLLVFYLLAGIFSWFCWASMAQRLGYESTGLIGLGMMIPLVNVFLFLFLVFSESPNEQRLRARMVPAAPNLESEAVREEATRTECPACGAPITPADVRCPDCGIKLR
jgi:hypothetical protein